MSGGHEVHGPSPILDTDIKPQAEGTFSKVLDALFLFGLIKHLTGNPHYGEGGGHDDHGGHH